MPRRFGSSTLGAARSEIERLGGTRCADPHHAAAGNGSRKKLGAELGSLQCRHLSRRHRCMHAGRGHRSSTRGDECVQGRLRGRARRRFDDRTRRGSGVTHRRQPALHPHHLRRVRDDADPGRDQDGLKTTVRDDAVLPETVIYDVDLTLSLPVALTATSGINAIARMRWKRCSARGATR